MNIYDCFVYFCIRKILKFAYLFFFFSKDWYKGQLTDKELDALENPKPKPKPTGGPSRRRGARPDTSTPP